MEEICKSLSAAVYGTGKGGYKIYYEDDLLETLPEDLRNRETLEAALKNLVAGGYLDVKYARGNVFCIAAVKKYEPTPDPETEEKREPAPTATTVLTKKIYALIAASAAAGSAIGGCIGALIGAVL